MRAILVILAVLIVAAPAHAGVTYEFGPHFGPTKPGPHSRWGYRGTSKPTISTPAKPKLSDRCLFYRGAYRLRHISRPDMLKTFHGCNLWKLDYAYHSQIDGLKRLIELSENPAVAAVSKIELLIINLTIKE